ncbi:hypothetical protein DPEC_G00224990 [Dallia pectoralis]|uniref:Uncharacterized protein n=1 Tax=Dallia pectoralis TaxID=75939 RepID=A0ACC2G014_DALPE|nr:hypothetical protein DPEC_G00224990 [Dallia pectoralis]
MFRKKSKQCKEALALQSGREANQLTQYARLNIHVPVLRMYMDVERDMRIDFRMSRQAFNGLLNMLRHEGDHGHPLHGRMQEHFNRKHCRAHSIIQKTFGVMKARWRATLSKAMAVRTKFCSEVALACAFLHNVCLTHGDVLEEPELQPEETLAPLEENEIQEGCGVYMRDVLCAQISAPLVPFKIV